MTKCLRLILEIHLFRASVSAAWNSSTFFFILDFYSCFSTPGLFAHTHLCILLRLLFRVENSNLSVSRLEGFNSNNQWSVDYSLLDRLEIHITFSSTSYHLLDYQCLTRLSKCPELQWTYLTAELLWAIQRTFLPSSDLLSSNCSGVCWNFSCSSKRTTYSYANWYILSINPGCECLRCFLNCTRLG